MFFFKTYEKFINLSTCQFKKCFPKCYLTISLTVKYAISYYIHIVYYTMWPLIIGFILNIEKVINKWLLINYNGIKVSKTYIVLLQPEVQVCELNESLNP